jgi:predicted heme/steroid binding protein
METGAVHFDVAGHASSASWRRGLFFGHYTAAKDVDARMATGWGSAHVHVRAELEGIPSVGMEGLAATGMGRGRRALWFLIWMNRG